MATTIQVPVTLTVPTGSRTTADARNEGHYSLLLGLSEEMNSRIEDLAMRTGYDKAEVINLAVALFKASLDAVEDGKRVGIVEDDREMQTEFLGFHRNDPPVE